MKTNKQLFTIILSMLLCMASFDYAYAGKFKSTMDIEALRESFENNSDKDETRAKILQYAAELDKAIANAPAYQEQKGQKIQALKNTIEKTDNADAKFSAMMELFNEYRNLNYDSMYVASLQMQKFARDIKDRDKLAQAMTAQAKALVLGGFFRQTEHIIKQVDTTGCSKQTQIDFLVTQFNMNFENGFYYRRVLQDDTFYNEMTRIESELKRLLPNGSILLKSLEVKKAFHSHEYEKAVDISLSYLNRIPKNTPEYSEWVGNLGYTLMGAGALAESMKYMTESAIYDIEQGSKSYPAIRKITEMFYVIGDLKHAYKYGIIAMDNYKQFGSKYRIAEISSYYPVISKWMYDTIEKKQNTMAVMTIVLSLIVVLLIATIVVIIKQQEAERRQKAIIAKQNEELSKKRDEIETFNKQLQESNKINNLILGRMLTANAGTMVNIEKYNKDIARKLKVKDYDGIRTMLDDIKSADIVGNSDIDKIILAIFPNFVAQFNSMLKEETRKNDISTLTPEMKIFALIRLGIEKNEDIARCLDYSVNTIKSYKTKVLNNALLPKEEFYRTLKADVFTVSPNL